MAWYWFAKALMVANMLSETPANLDSATIMRLRYGIVGKFIVWIWLLLDTKPPLLQNGYERFGFYSFLSFRNSSVKCPLCFGFENLSLLYDCEFPFGIDSEVQPFSASIFPKKTICPM